MESKASGLSFMQTQAERRWPSVPLSQLSFMNSMGPQRDPRLRRERGTLLGNVECGALCRKVFTDGVTAQDSNSRRLPTLWNKAEAVKVGHDFCQDRLSSDGEGKGRRKRSQNRMWTARGPRVGQGVSLQCTPVLSRSQGPRGRTGRLTWCLHMTPSYLTPLAGAGGFHGALTT